MTDLVGVFETIDFDGSGSPGVVVELAAKDRVLAHLSQRPEADRPADHPRRRSRSTADDGSAMDKKEGPKPCHKIVSKLQSA